MPPENALENTPRKCPEEWGKYGRILSAAHQQVNERQRPVVGQFEFPRSRAMPPERQLRSERQREGQPPGPWRCYFEDFTSSSAHCSSSRYWSQTMAGRDKGSCAKA